MKDSYCDGEGGRTRVAFVNMSEPGLSCPPGLVQYDDIFNTSLCYIHERAYIANSRAVCNSTFFPPYGLNYTKVCGQVRGYEYGTPWAFHCYISDYNCNPELKALLHMVTIFVVIFGVMLEVHMNKEHTEIVVLVIMAVNT